MGVLFLSLCGVFVAFYYLDGVLRERQFEVLCYAVGAAVIMLYVIVNYAVKKEEGQRIRLVSGTFCDTKVHMYSLLYTFSQSFAQARLVLVCVGAPVNIALALVVWWKMGYLVFNIVGSNERLLCEL